MAVNLPTVAPSVSTITNASSTSIGETHINVFKSSHTWTIFNFSACKNKPSAPLFSPMFTAGLKENCKWHIKLNPYGDADESKNLLSIYLRSAWTNIEVVFTVKSAFSIIDSMKNEKNSRGTQFCTYGYRDSKGFHRFISRDDLLKERSTLLPNDTLTILVELSIVVDTVNIAGVKNSQILPECRFFEDFSDLYDSKKFSDVTFIIGDEKFTAHRAILAARCRVFSTMFENEMAEGQLTNVVRITGIDGVTFEAMLRFLYSTKTNNIEQIASKLLVAAKIYKLERLKGLCEETLCKGLTTSNVVDQLILADTHGAGHLKTRAIAFFGAHMKDVMATAGYGSLHVTHPKLMDETMQTLFYTLQTNNATCSGITVGASAPSSEKKSLEDLKKISERISGGGKTAAQVTRSGIRHTPPPAELLPRRSSRKRPKKGPKKGPY